MNYKGGSTGFSALLYLLVDSVVYVAYSEGE